MPFCKNCFFSYLLMLIPILPFLLTLITFINLTGTMPGTENHLFFHEKTTGFDMYRLFCIPLFICYLSVSLFQQGVSMPMTSDVNVSAPPLKWAVAFFTYLNPI